MTVTKPSVLIVGAGEFGASTAVSLLRSGKYGQVTVIDRAPQLPAMDAASCDINKVVRFDYIDPVYANLAREAITEWNKDEWKGIYYQSGVVVRGKTGSTKPPSIYELVRSIEPATRLLTSTDEFRAAVAPNPSIPVADFPQDIRGYHNPTGGWADASKAVEKLYVDLKALGGKLVPGVEFSELVFTEDGKDVKGVKSADGRTFEADKVIVALGSWTPSHPALGGLLPQGLITATGQTVAAVQLSPEDQKRYADIPVSMHFDGSAYYSFPPNESGLLKFALHGAGYVSEDGVPRTAADPQAVAYTEENKIGWIPSLSLKTLRAEIGRIYPEIARMPIAYTRMCWYSDVVDGDWVIDVAPEYPSLLFATGGAGHAFKFLPIIGDLIRSRLEGTLDPQLAKKWRITRTSDQVDPARAGLQRAPLDLKGFVTKEELGEVAVVV
ncbi:hypothetical protein IAT38_004063 [Cryptococcus sp. DSM 104549]